MSKKKSNVKPEIRAYFSELSKKRKHPYLHFNDPEKAREAGQIGKESQRIKRERRKKQEDSSEM